MPPMFDTIPGFHAVQLTCGATESPAASIAARIAQASGSSLATAALNTSSFDSGRRCWFRWTKLAASSAALA
ncbi:MAG: hypothetical protein CL955_03915 [Erythrobacteraceae bacterium]|nr:hypothetical protein [Erythrobacteraceae bacterium]